MDGLIVAFDGEQGLPEGPMNVFMPDAGSKLKHVSLMSRYLNGKGMGFTVNAAKIAANAEIWAGSKAAKEMYQGVEQRVTRRAAELGASYTIIRAGTLKGGGQGDTTAEDGGGEKTFLDPYFYTLGQQDLVNWRLLFDCSSLGVELSRGDTLPGPGFTAALTATGLGDGDSHRGAVATALVEALAAPAAADADFSVKTIEGREFPKGEATWAKLFEGAR